MKKILIVFLLCLTVLPFSVDATEVKYESLNLEEVLTEEKIEFDLSNYKETDDQITIYLFRGNGCGYCKSFLTFLNSIVDEYGKYFKLVSYETWYSRDNYDLMTKVSEFLEQPASGVPYIIIGDQVFAGYSSNYDDAIKKAIKELYDSKNRYDVFDEIEKEEKIARIKKNIETLLNISGVVAIVFTGTVLFIVLKENKKLNSKLYQMNEKIDVLEEKINSQKKIETTEKKEVKPKKKTTKKETTKKETTKKETTKKETTKKETKKETAKTKNK